MYNKHIYIYREREREQERERERETYVYLYTVNIHEYTYIPKIVQRRVPLKGSLRALVPSAFQWLGQG